MAGAFEDPRTVLIYDDAKKQLEARAPPPPDPSFDRASLLPSDRSSDPSLDPFPPLPSDPSLYRRPQNAPSARRP